MLPLALAIVLVVASCSDGGDDAQSGGSVELGDTSAETQAAVVAAVLSDEDQHSVYRDKTNDYGTAA